MYTLTKTVVQDQLAKHGLCGQLVTDTALICNCSAGAAGGILSKRLATGTMADTAFYGSATQGSIS